MMYFNLACILCVIASGISSVKALIDPTEIYDGGFGPSRVLLRIATGGAGQSGLVKLLSNAFIQYKVNQGYRPFSIGWVLSDTTFTIKNLQTGEADLGISYVPAAEEAAGNQGIIDPNKGRFYLFRDHFVIAGPPENPAEIDDSQNATTIFAKIYQAGELNDAKTTVPTRFLSRFDKSATNIKESTLWLGIGQAPWSLPYSTWYTQYPVFPIQALTAASLLKEYTLSDKGTYLSLLELDPEVAKATSIYKIGSDDKADPLLLPGHVLVAKNTERPRLAYDFARWATSSAGQSVVTGMEKNGQQLYSGAPQDEDDYVPQLQTIIPNLVGEKRAKKPRVWVA